MTKLVNGCKYEIIWTDTVAYHGWYKVYQIEDIIKDYIVKSTGYFVGKTKLFTVIAKSHQTQSDEYGNLTYIPTKTIIKIKRL